MIGSNVTETFRRLLEKLETTGHEINNSSSNNDEGCGSNADAYDEVIHL